MSQHHLMLDLSSIRKSNQENNFKKIVENQLTLDESILSPKFYQNLIE